MLIGRLVGQNATDDNAWICGYYFGIRLESLLWHVFQSDNFGAWWATVGQLRKFTPRFNLVQIEQFFIAFCAANSPQSMWQKLCSSSAHNVTQIRQAHLTNTNNI